MNRLLRTNCLDKWYQHYYVNGCEYRGNVLPFIEIAITWKKLKRLVNFERLFAFCLSIMPHFNILIIYFVNNGLPNPIAASLRPRKTCMTPLRLSTEFSHAFKMYIISFKGYEIRMVLLSPKRKQILLDWKKNPLHSLRVRFICVRF